MTGAAFKKTLFISLLGHITVFGVFSFSSGDRFLKANYIPVYFLGSMLSNSDLSNRSINSYLSTRYKVSNMPIILTHLKSKQESGLTYPQYVKPSLPLAVNREKIAFVPKDKLISSVSKRKEATITFHPYLPLHFLLYFRDRQKAHIEVMFNIVSSAKVTNILLKRRISSGNLEVDLLSMRYIGHYLFIQQARLVPNVWQTVKIDLSTKND
jgi:hypothetical protein